MGGSCEDLKERLMRTDAEEIEEKLKSGYYDVDAREVALQVIDYKRQHPDVTSVEKPVSKTTRRITLIVTVGLVATLYFGLKVARRTLSD